MSFPAKTKPESHHSRILADIRQNILEGTWAPGFQLPKETELAERFGVSRMTMNKVLTQLAGEGFLLRRKRSGTVVAHQRAQSAVMEINDIAQEVAELGLDYSWKLLERKSRTPSESETLLLDMSGAELDSRILFLVGLHYANGTPFCLETRVINLDTVPHALDQDFDTVIPGQWLLHTMPWSGATHRVRAVNCVTQSAKLLELPVGSACLEVLRKTRIEKTWVTHVRLLYPGAAHQLLAEFAPHAIAP